MAVYVHLASSLLEATDRDMALMWKLTEYEVGESDASAGAATVEDADGDDDGVDPVRAHADGAAPLPTRVPEATVARFRPTAVMVTAADVRAVLHQRPEPRADDADDDTGDSAAVGDGGKATWSYVLLFSDLQIVVCSPVSKTVAQAAPSSVFRVLPRWVVHEFRLWLTSTTIGATRCRERVSSSSEQDVMTLLHCVPSQPLGVPAEAGVGATDASTDGGNELDGKVMSVEVVIKPPNRRQPYKDVRVTVGTLSMKRHLRQTLVRRVSPVLGLHVSQMLVAWPCESSWTSTGSGM